LGDCPQARAAEVTRTSVTTTPGDGEEAELEPNDASPDAERRDAA